MKTENPMEPVSVPVGCLELLPELQLRASTPEDLDAWTAEYADLRREDVIFPPIQVVHDEAHDRYIVTDGFLRTASARRAGLVEIPALVHTPRPGKEPLDLARWLAAGANHSHGHRRSHADRRRAVARVLAWWPDFTDEHLASIVKVDARLVRAVARETSVERPARRLAQDGRWIEVHEPLTTAPVAGGHGSGGGNQDQSPEQPDDDNCRGTDADEATETATDPGGDNTAAADPRREATPPAGVGVAIDLGMPRAPAEDEADEVLLDELPACIRVIARSARALRVTPVLSDGPGRTLEFVVRGDER